MFVFGYRTQNASVISFLQFKLRKNYYYYKKRKYTITKRRRTYLIQQTQLYRFFCDDQECHIHHRFYYHIDCWIMSEYVLGFLIADGVATDLWAQFHSFSLALCCLRLLSFWFLIYWFICLFWWSVYNYYLLWDSFSVARTSFIFPAETNFFLTQR